MLVKCYHGTKNLLTDWKFILGVTITFPIEHALWFHAPGFSHIAQFLGLLGGHAPH